jgi:hypothetical protein
MLGEHFFQLEIYCNKAMFGELEMVQALIFGGIDGSLLLSLTQPSSIQKRLE